MVFNMVRVFFFLQNSILPSIIVFHNMRWIFPKKTRYWKLLSCFTWWDGFIWILPSIIVFGMVKLFHFRTRYRHLLSRFERLMVSFQNKTLPPVIVFHMVRWFQFRLNITTYDRVSHGEVISFQNSRPTLTRHRILHGEMVSFQNYILPSVKLFHMVRCCFLLSSKLDIATYYCVSQYEIFSEVDIETYCRVSHGETVSFQNLKLPPIIVFHMMKWFHFKLDITTYDRVSHGEIVLVQNLRPPLIRDGFILEFPWLKSRDWQKLLTSIQKMRLPSAVHRVLHVQVVLFHNSLLPVNTTVFPIVRWFCFRPPDCHLHYASYVEIASGHNGRLLHSFCFI